MSKVWLKLNRYTPLQVSQLEQNFQEPGGPHTILGGGWVGGGGDNQPDFY